MRWLGPAAVATCFTFVSPVAAHESEPPRVIDSPTAVWPGDPSPHDVVVPVIITVAADGTVEHVEIEVSVGPSLDEAAIRAAKRWRFKPAQSLEGPRRAKVRAVIRFEGVAPDAALEIPTDVQANASEPPSQSSRAPSPGAPDVPPAEAPTDVTIRGTAPPRSASEIRVERDVLQAAPHRTGSDLLKTVPGVFITQHSGEGKAHQIFFRGFDAVHGQDLEISVAGVPVNDVSNVHGQGYADLHFVMPEVVDEVQALPGAFDPSQGDFAIAGSLRYRLGYAEPGVTVKGGYGSYNARRLFVAYHPEGQPDDTFAAAEIYETDGFGVARKARRASAMGQAVVPLQTGLWVRLMTSVYAGTFESAGVLPIADIQSGAVDRFDSYDEAQGGDASRVQAIAELTYDRDGTRASLAPYFVRRTMRLDHNFTGFLGDPVGGDLNEQHNDATTVGLNAHFRKQVTLLSEHDSIGAGILGRHDTIAQRHYLTASADELVRADITATDIGAYADVAVRPISRVVVRGGVRADGLAYAVDDKLAAVNRSAQGAFMGPRITTDVALMRGLHALGSYGQGFRSPQARSLGDGEETPLTRMHGFELGVRYAQDRTVVATLAGYLTLLEDDLVFNEATSRNETSPGTQRMGAAGSLTVREGDWFTSAFGASYTRAVFRSSDGRFEEGDLVPFVPQVVLRSDMSVRPVVAHIARRPLRAIFGTGMGGIFRRPLPFAEIGSDVFLVDVKAGLRYGPVEFEASVDNLFDAEWFDGEFVYASQFNPGAGASSLARRHASVGAPRTVWFSLAATI